MNPGNDTAHSGAAGPRIVRHALTDRCFHWLTAASVLTLLATAFLPIMGIKFPWVTTHWIAGLILTVAVAFHLVRTLFWQRLKTIWFGLTDLKEALASLGRFLKIKKTEAAKPGKYSPAQKLMHHVVTVFILTAVVTGLLMMAKIDTPFWKRNPYWLSSDSWGIIYILHDFAALSLVTLIMVHVYFALRPEKLFYTRSMIKGWISREEYLREHDPERWREGEP